jgi:hypothetical protein
MMPNALLISSARVQNADWSSLLNSRHMQRRAELSHVALEDLRLFATAVVW